MKTFREFCEQAVNAANQISSVKPFRVMPPLRKADGSYNPAPMRYLIDPITGFGPGGFKGASVTPQRKNGVA